MGDDKPMTNKNEPIKRINDMDDELDQGQYVCCYKGEN